MTILKEICNTKKDWVLHKKKQIAFDTIRTQAEQTPHPKRPFIKAINEAPPAFICEIKKASPSKGIIRPDFNPEVHARDYEEAGATCLSILTDEPYFQGSDDYLTRIRKKCSLPLLRKDFIIDPYQLYESKMLGADCILLIMAALSDTQAQDFYALATELDLDVLVEIHTLEELERALRFSPQMIGVNNRNLKTMAVDLQISKDLFQHIPDPILKICESGIKTSQHIQDMIDAGADGFLIGESLMRQDNIKAAFQSLTKNIKK